MAGVESKIVDEKPKDIRPAIDREKVKRTEILKIPANLLKSIKNAALI
jgi:hypothetical protein